MAGSQRRAEPRVVHEARAAPFVQRDLHEIDAPRRAAREAIGRPPQAREPIRAEAHARAKAPARAAGLHLDHDQGLALREHEVELGPARFQAPREKAPAARPQRPLDQALSRPGEQRVAGREHAQREPRRRAREQRARPADQTLLGSAFSSSAASFSASITLWIAAREKRRRTLSATCSTATSAVVVTTVP